MGIGGFDYEQVKRQGKIAIYKQTKPGQPLNVHYEVGVIRQNKSWSAFGLDYEASESWPRNEEWGTLAWTYQDLPSARLRFETLTKP